MTSKPPSADRAYLSLRADPLQLKRQRRQELKRAAEWEKATGVITGRQAALDKEVNATKTWRGMAWWSVLKLCCDVFARGVTSFLHNTVLTF